jgi:hypothetical protein
MIDYKPTPYGCTLGFGPEQLRDEFRRIYQLHYLHLREITGEVISLEERHELLAPGRTPIFRRVGPTRKRRVRCECCGTLYAAQEVRVWQEKETGG